MPAPVSQVADELPGSAGLELQATTDRPESNARVRRMFFMGSHGSTAPRPLSSPPGAGTIPTLRPQGDAMSRGDPPIQST